jgi:hypothetical protein
VSKPWSDWIPGVLSKRQLRDLCSTNNIIGAKESDVFFDHSSIDLTLTEISLPGCGTDFFEV